MTDRYARIRKALAMGPTPGPWRVLVIISVGADCLENKRRAAAMLRKREQTYGAHSAMTGGATDMGETDG